MGALAVVEGNARGLSETAFLYLSGSGFGDTVDWDFRIDRGRGAGSWTRIPVPSQWELAGFGSYAYGAEDPDRDRHAESARYRHRFEVPESWRDRRVRLVFEGVMTDAAVEINGRSAGRAHRGGFTPFSFDITDLLAFGDSNLLEVEVSEASADGSVNAAERDADYWVFGGIYRPVYLEALPARAITHVAIDARANGELTVALELSGARGDETVTARVRELDSDRTVRAELDGSLGGSRGKIELRGRAPAVRSWSAERPYLYVLEVSLTDASGTVHSIERKFGFRTVELRPGQGLFINDRRVLLKGVNRHSLWPESGRALNRELNRRDAELIKELNANAVRTAHYPPDSDFLTACDELGLYVIDELPGWHDAYRSGVGSRLIGEMVRRDVNHPSVILWANGNEGGSNSLLDREFERHDPQARRVLYPGSKAGGVEAIHYPTYDELRSALRGDSWLRRLGRLWGPQPLVLPTEMLHGLYDGGGGAGLEAYWALIARSDRGVGGFLWSLFDEGVVRTDREGSIDTFGNLAPDGIVGPYREPEASFASVHDLWSPIEMEAADWRSGRVRLRNLYTETNLSELRFRWQTLVLPAPGRGFGAAAEQVVFESVSPGPDVAPSKSGSLQMAVIPDTAFDALRLTAIDPAGREVRTWSGWVADRTHLQSRWLDTGAGPDEGSVSAPEWLGALQPTAGKTPAAHWKVLPTGWVRLEVDNADPSGFGFSLPGLETEEIEWLGDGPGAVWANRLAGPKLGVWRRALDDSAAPWRGARGFYGGVRWIKLRGRSGVLTAVVESEDLFVGVSSPRFPPDAKQARAHVPELGEISFVWRIPAIGTKFHEGSMLAREPESLALSLRRAVVWFRLDPR